MSLLSETFLLIVFNLRDILEFHLAHLKITLIQLVVFKVFWSSSWSCSIILEVIWIGLVILESS